ncbi:hypothetical protein CTI12_AA425300 [Artemisia annua]|uniref:Uncharacterized protein n=1 Tax=Artemisia annua TaxID=35608 RepID=A0A2U1M391_ARTAN|nr:hypothetical protein CTI12_AA425300 [Artemisia annua]
MDGEDVSLTLVTLTTIAVSLPEIQNDTFKSFLKGVREEVDVHHKWLRNNLKKRAPEVNAAAKILQTIQLKTRSPKCKASISEAQMILPSTSLIICANSVHLGWMSHQYNLPQVIVTKCHESVIDKRESSVHAAAQLLVRTAQIIIRLHERELPRLKSDELPFIDKWRSYYKHPTLRKPFLFFKSCFNASYELQNH